VQSIQCPFFQWGRTSLAVGPVAMIENDVSKGLGPNWSEEMLIDRWHQDG